MNFNMVPEAPDELWPEGIPVCLPQPLDSAYIPAKTGCSLPHQEAHFLFVQILVSGCTKKERAACGPQGGSNFFFFPLKYTM